MSHSINNILITVNLLTAILFSFHHHHQVTGLSDEMKELAASLHASCIAETNANEDAIPRAIKGDFSEEQSFKCYLKCLMEQMAIIDDDGTIDVDAMVAVLPDDIAEYLEGAIRKCGSKKGVDACDSAWLTNKCYQQEAPEHYFLF